MNESNNKRIAKNTLLLYVRMLFMMVIGLYTSRVRDSKESLANTYVEIIEEI